MLPAHASASSGSILKGSDKHHFAAASPSVLPDFLQQAAHLRAGIMADIGPELEQQKELELEAQLKKVWGAGSIV